MKLNLENKYENIERERDDLRRMNCLNVRGVYGDTNGRESNNISLFHESNIVGPFYFEGCPSSMFNRLTSGNYPVRELNTGLLLIPQTPVDYTLEFSRMF